MGMKKATLYTERVLTFYWFYRSEALMGSGSHRGTTLDELRIGLRPHFKKLLPRFLRACHDPNQRVQAQMRSLWDGLTGGGAESRSLITDHFLSIFDDLISETASKLWRARAGASGALIEIIVGRQWSDFGGGPPLLDDEIIDTRDKNSGTRLIHLWSCAMRLMDDVHGVVRDKGAALGRAVRSLTINLCDPNSSRELASGNKRDRVEDAEDDIHSAAAARTALHWLVRRGFNQQFSGAAGVCVTTIVGIVKVVNPKIVDPSLPELVRALLWAMSGLEPAAMNYLQFHVDDKEGLEKARLRMTQVGPLADALNRCIELLPLSGDDTKRRMASELDAALRQSVGFASRAAVADTVSSITNSCPTIFSESKISTAQLIKALYLASEREFGDGAKQKMVQALGNLAALSPGPTVRLLAIRACKRYNTCTGNSFDEEAQKVAAAVVRAIAVKASAHMKQGGEKDVWRTIVLPTAFLGRKDENTRIAELWDDVWKEAGHSVMDAASGRESFGTLLEEQLLPEVVSAIIAALQDVAWSRRVAAASAISELSSLGVLSPLRQHASDSAKASTERLKQRTSASKRILEQCVGLLKKQRIWTGKSKVMKAYVRAREIFVSKAI
jgi:proteasome component ECM29